MYPEFIAVNLILMKGMERKMECASCGHTFDWGNTIGLATPSPRAPHGGICCAKCGAIVTHNRSFVDLLATAEPDPKREPGRGDENWRPTFVEGA